MKTNKFKKFITSFLIGLILMNCANGNSQNNLSKEATLALEKLATGGSADSSDSTASNLSVNASRVDTSTYTRVYRLFNGRDHMASHIPGESGFGTEGSWYYYRNQQPSSKALYRCLATWGDHFVSHDPNCEGQIKEGKLGYLLQKDPNDGRHVPLHRCFAGDHFVSQSSNCEGHTFGFVFGYAVAVDKVNDRPLTNIAMGKTATQSSLFHNGFASKAVDGNTNGHGNSITHTNLDYQPWWMVDLGADYAVKGITISNRTDGWGHRLKDVGITLLDSSNNEITYQRHSQIPKFISIYADNVRKVKIQIIGRSEYLSLAEVQVWRDDTSRRSLYSRKKKDKDNRVLVQITREAVKRTTTNRRSMIRKIKDRLKKLMKKTMKAARKGRNILELIEVLNTIFILEAGEAQQERRSANARLQYAENTLKPHLMSRHHMGITDANDLQLEPYVQLLENENPFPDSVLVSVLNSINRRLGIDERYEYETSFAVNTAVSRVFTRLVEDLIKNIVNIETQTRISGREGQGIKLSTKKEEDLVRIIKKLIEQLSNKENKLSIGEILTTAEVASYEDYLITIHEMIRELRNTLFSNRYIRELRRHQESSAFHPNSPIARDLSLLQSIDELGILLNSIINTIESFRTNGGTERMVKVKDNNNRKK
ncbi:MAG: discoidin domain-containing protein [Spirochaetota bacterium]